MKCPHCNSVRLHKRKFIVEIRWRDIATNGPRRKQVAANASVWANDADTAIAVVADKLCSASTDRHFWQKCEAEVVDVTDDKNIAADFGFH